MTLTKAGGHHFGLSGANLPQMLHPWEQWERAEDGPRGKHADRPSGSISRTAVDTALTGGANRPGEIAPAGRFGFPSLRSAIFHWRRRQSTNRALPACRVPPGRLHRLVGRDKRPLGP